MNSFNSNRDSVLIKELKVSTILVLRTLWKREILILNRLSLNLCSKSSISMRSLKGGVHLTEVINHMWQEFQLPSTISLTSTLIMTTPSIWTWIKVQQMKSLEEIEKTQPPWKIQEASPSYKATWINNLKDHKLKMLGQRKEESQPTSWIHEWSPRIKTSQAWTMSWVSKNCWLTTTFRIKTKFQQIYARKMVIWRREKLI